MFFDISLFCRTKWNMFESVSFFGCIAATNFKSLFYIPPNPSRVSPAFMFPRFSFLEEKLYNKKMTETPFFFLIFQRKITGCLCFCFCSPSFSPDQETAFAHPRKSNKTKSVKIWKPPHSFPPLNPSTFLIPPTKIPISPFSKLKIKKMLNAFMKKKNPFG